jgi:hypothetical protein
MERFVAWATLLETLVDGIGELERNGLIRHGFVLHFLV